MKSPLLKAVTEVISLAPQFLVDDLSEAIGYYRDRLGFEPDFVYESLSPNYSVNKVIWHLFKSDHVRLVQYRARKQAADL
jgi:hypothetical protein